METNDVRFRGGKSHAPNGDPLKGGEGLRHRLGIARVGEPRPIRTDRDSPVGGHGLKETMVVGRGLLEGKIKNHRARLPCSHFFNELGVEIAVPFFERGRLEEFPARCVVPIDDDRVIGVGVHAQGKREVVTEVDEAGAKRRQPEEQAEQGRPGSADNLAPPVRRDMILQVQVRPDGKLKRDSRIPARPMPAQKRGQGGNIGIYFPAGDLLPPRNSQKKAQRHGDTMALPETFPILTGTSSLEFHANQYDTVMRV